jgi:aminoglycoside phosphotransferase (APT) family kinase protein
MAPRVSSDPMRCGFQVLNHGDDYINNMLFMRDERGDFVDVRFIDYQMSFWGSPITDLMYFLLTSVRDEIKTAHFDELVAFYHKELIKCLIELKYDQNVPTLDALKQDLMEKRGFSKY